MAARLPASPLPVAWRGPLPALIHGLGLGPATRAWLEGHDLQGRPYRLTQQRGQVVLVVFWSAACAGCRDLLAELHGRRAAWPAQDFAIVMVATDARREDATACEHLLPPAPGVTSLWRAAPGHRDGFGQPEPLPTAFVLDREGRIVERHAGRLPADAWTRIEALLRA